MPDLTYSFTVAQANRIAAALRTVPDKDGAMPAANATQAQLLAHARRVILAGFIAQVRSIEIQPPDPDLESIV